MSAVVQLLTGGHLAAARFEVAALTGTTTGQLVLAMVVLWLLLAGLVEIGVARLLRVLDAESVGAAGRASARVFRAAGVVAVLLLLVGGILAA